MTPLAAVPPAQLTMVFLRWLLGVTNRKSCVFVLLIGLLSSTTTPSSVGSMSNRIERRVLVVALVVVVVEALSLLACWLRSLPSSNEVRSSLMAAILVEYLVIRRRRRLWSWSYFDEDIF